MQFIKIVEEMCQIAEEWISIGENEPPICKHMDLESSGRTMRGHFPLLVVSKMNGIRTARSQR